MDKLSMTIDQTSTDKLLDQQSKAILLLKPVIIRILKYAVKELEEYSLEEIGYMLDSMQKNYELEPGSIDSEDKELGLVNEEGKMTCDIRFILNIPETEDVRLYIDVEAQNKQDPRIPYCNPWHSLCQSHPFFTIRKRI